MLEPTDYQIALAESWGAEERMLLVPGAFGLRMAEAFTNLRHSKEHGLEQWTGRVWLPVTDQQLTEMLDLTSALVDVEAANASGILRKPARVAAYAADSRTPAFREQAVAALKRDRKVELVHSNDPWLVRLTDGTVLDLDTLADRSLFRTDPEYRRLNAAYDPQAECPACDAYVAAVAECNDVSAEQLWRTLALLLLPELGDDEPCCLVLDGDLAAGFQTMLARFVRPSGMALGAALSAGVPTVSLWECPSLSGRTRHLARRVVSLSINDHAAPDAGSLHAEASGVLNRLLDALRAYYVSGVVAA
jgi:hypothetical protein